MNKPVLCLLAAGMGSRYGGMKQIDPMDEYGNLIIDFSIYDALSAGFEDIVFIIKKAIDADFREVIGERVSRRANVAYAYQELDMLPEGVSVPDGRVKPWGTTHAVLCARSAIAGRPFAVINSDDYYGPAAFRELYGFLQNNSDENSHAIVGYNIENTLTEHGSVARGLCVVNSDGYLTDIRERTNIVKTPECASFIEDGAATPIPRGTTVSMNCWAFNPGMMRDLESIFSADIRPGIAANPLKFEDLLPNAARVAIGRGSATVKVLPTPDRWFGVTYKEDKPSVAAALRALKNEGVYKEKLWE